jgi:hypothetical protein
VLAALRRLRFTGWVAPPDGNWVVAVPARPDGTVAARRRGVLDLGAEVATALRVPVLAARVVRDRQLVLAGWQDGQEIGRYISDPAFDHDGRAELLSEPLGVEDAGALAAACGHPEASEELRKLLARELDPESFIESERLAAAVKMLQLPHWLVSVAALPRNLPTGPRRADLSRLRAGAAGAVGLVLGLGTERIRRRRRQPPVVADPPRRRTDVDPWLL